MDDTSIKSNLSESDWIEAESLKTLMRPRMQMSWFAGGTMMAMAFQLHGHLNTYLIVAWLIVSLLVLFFRHHIKCVFNQHLTNADIQTQKAFVEKNQLAWSL